MTNTTQPTAARISAMILQNVANGLSTIAAIDAVLGAGTFAALAGNVYDTLRATSNVEGR